MQYVGIDVSKAELVVHVLPSESRSSFTNDQAGWKQISRAFKGAEVRFALEATGGYERGVVEHLTDLGHYVVRYSPDRVKAFGRSLGTRAKTDPIDARTIALMLRAFPDSPPVRADRELRVSRGLLRRRDQLVRQRDDERRRLAHADGMAARSIKRMLTTLQRELKTIEKALTAAVDLLAGEDELLKVKGIGRITQASLRIDLPELGQLSQGQIAAMVGVAPFNADSGKSSGKRFIQGGRPRVRRSLYMATISAIRYNPAIKARYERLRGAGKLKKVAIVACMRALLVTLNAMIRDGTPWRSEPLV